MISSVYGEGSDLPLTMIRYAVKPDGSCTYAIMEGSYGTIEPSSRPYDEAQSTLRGLYLYSERNEGFMSDDSLFS